MRCKDGSGFSRLEILDFWKRGFLAGRDGRHHKLLSKERADSSELWLLVILVAAGQGGCTELKLEAFAQWWVGLDAA